MAWLSSNGVLASDAATHTMFNNLANDDQNWGGNVNGGGYTLSNIGALTAASVTGRLTVLGHTSNEVARFQGNGLLANRSYISIYNNNANFWWEISDEDATGGGSTNGLSFNERSNTAAVGRLYLAQGGFIGAGIQAPTRQVHIVGIGQSVSAISDSGFKGGTLYIQDSGAAGGNGGAVLFGASQGSFAAVKALLTNGAGNSLGHLAFSVRATTAATALTEAMRITELGRVGIGKVAPGSVLAVVGYPIHADNTAALAGGLTAGDQYRTSTGAVMVTF